MPLIISTQDRWDPDSCKLETHQQSSQPQHLQLVTDTLQLLGTINKPVAVLSICGPYRSGKSYFISRLLGKPGAFQLGHRMQACTHGIWMATTVLECEEFATILLDTEGIDAIGACETMAMSLLAVTTLLSSYLIYNSQKVPQKVDLDKMRCFTQLSSSILMQKGICIDMGAKQKFFPHFLWLLRDVTLTVTNKAGQTISATEFLHTQVLASPSGQLTEMGKSLCSLFPSLECHTLPMPTANPKLIKNIVKQQDKLKPAFNKAVEDLIQCILQQITPKRAGNGVSLVDGPALAALAHGYVDAINTSEAMPDLQQGWQAVIKWKLKELSEKLVEEYRREMEECLEGTHPLGSILPVEETTLMGIHEQKLNRKRESLQQEICRLDPLSLICGEDPLLTQLDEVISQTNERGEVIGGALFQFTTKNYSVSKQQCEEVFREIVKNSGIHQRCNEAFVEARPFDIWAEIQKIKQHYYEHCRVVGPAVEEVLTKGCQELAKEGDILRRIPGPPTEVKIIGEGPDRVKLSWLPPKQNPKAVEKYVVLKQEEEKQWERVRETKKTKMLITGLKFCTHYQFQVIATNDLIRSVEVTQSSFTRHSKKKVTAKAVTNPRNALSSMQVVLSLPIVVDYNLNTNITLTETYKAAQEHRIAVTAAMLPAAIVAFPITLPLVTATVTRMELQTNTKGDITPVSDDEI